MPGGSICHFSGTRIRVVGDADLQITFYSLDKINSQALVPLPLNSTDARVPLRLANFITQRGKVRLEVQSLDEYFKVNDVTVFMKPLWSEFPG